MSSGGSWHAVLGVGKNAGKSEIIKAYRTLALQHHPDKGGSEEKFKEINRAYEEKRRMNFLSGNKYKMWQAKQEKKKDSHDRQAFMEAKAQKARQAGYRGGAKASNGCDIRIPKQDSGSRDTKEGKGGKKKNAKGKDKDAEGNKIGRGIGDDSTKLAEDQFCTVTVTGDTTLKANGGKRCIQLMLGYGQNVERALADLGVEAKMSSLEEMTDGKSKEKKDSSSPADVRAAAARAEGQEAPTWVYEAKAKSVASPVEVKAAPPVETKNWVDPVDSPSSPAAKQINNLMAYEMANQRDRLACSKEFVQRTAAQKMVQEEGLHPEWSLTQRGLSSGSSLQVEDEGQGRSINLVIPEEPDLDEQLNPGGFKVDENDMFSNLAWVFSSIFACCIRGSPSF